MDVQIQLPEKSSTLSENVGEDLEESKNLLSEQSPAVLDDMDSQDSTPEATPGAIPIIDRATIMKNNKISELYYPR